MRNLISWNMPAAFQEGHHGKRPGDEKGGRIVCRRCGSRVRPEREQGLREEYPYYCPRCDENIYSFECVEM